MCPLKIHMLYHNSRHPCHRHEMVWTSRITREITRLIYEGGLSLYDLTIVGGIPEQEKGKEFFEERLDDS